MDNLKYIDRDLYQVETNEDGSKRVHIDGYVYENDEGYQLVNFTFAFLDVSELNRDNLEYVYEDVNQYQNDITEAQASNYYLNAKELPYEEVTESTPDGFYIDYSEGLL